jgi:hypothetical protein
MDTWLSHDQLVFIVGTMLTHEVVFWSYGLFFWLCRRNKWFEEYRIGPAPPEKLVSAMMTDICVSHFVTQPVSLWALFFLAQAFGLKFDVVFDPFWSVCTLT